MRSVKLALAAVAAIGAAMLFTVPATEAQARTVCKQHTHVARAIGFFPAFVRIRAIAKWRNEVRDHDGQRWARFANSCNERVRCDRIGGERNFNARFVCIARGRPGIEVQLIRPLRLQ